MIVQYEQETLFLTRFDLCSEEFEPVRQFRDSSIRYL